MFPFYDTSMLNKHSNLTKCRDLLELTTSNDDDGRFCRLDDTFEEVNVLLQYVYGRQIRTPTCMHACVRAGSRHARNEFAHTQRSIPHAIDWTESSGTSQRSRAHLFIHTHHVTKPSYRSAASAVSASAHACACLRAPQHNPTHSALAAVNLAHMLVHISVHMYI